MIEEKIAKVKEDLSIFDNDLEKYDYIIDLGKDLDGFDEAKRKEEFLVKGCTSKLWLYPEMNNGKVSFHADADAVIVKGLAKILTEVFSDVEPKEIEEFDKNLLNELGLEEIISVGRQNGLANTLERIKDYAKGVK